MLLDVDVMADMVVQTIQRALAPMQAEVKSLQAQIVALEARPLPKDGTPGPCGNAGQDGAPGPTGATGPDGPAGTAGRDGRDGLPGVPGLPGEKGIDGAAGRDGVDGLGFNDIDEKLEDGGRFLVRTYMAGDRLKTFRHQTSMPVYRGQYVEGKTYECGDTATSGGSLWHCNALTSTKPGDGSKAWTLAVKRGSNGHDWREGDKALPVVKVGR